MKIKKYKKSEKGFIVVLAILMLLVMSLMGTTLVVIASNDHKGNTLRDYNQQTFYAAETGIQEAKEYLNQQVQKGVTLKPYDIGPLNFCKTSFFPSLSDNMSYVKAIGPHPGSARKGWASLSHLGGSDAAEKKRLAKYQYEWFITQTPDTNGSTSYSPPKTKTVAGTEGSSIAEGTSYKSGGTSTGTHYTIFSCGCNAAGSKCKQGDNTIVSLIADVVLVQ